MARSIVRAVLVAAWGVVSLACRTVESAPPGPPGFSIVNSQVWRLGDLRLVGPDLASTSGLTVLFDDSLVVDTALLTFAGSDTIVATIELPGGPHTVSIEVRGERSAARAFEVGGLRGSTWAGDWPATTPLSYTLPRPLGLGSPQMWVGTSKGLALFDVRDPAQTPALVDSTVDPSCLYEIGASANGAVVTADRGCGTLRARVYSMGSAPVELDSGPRAWPLNGGSGEQPVRHALNYPPGVWLLAKYDTVAVAVRGPAGAWQWSAWRAGSVQRLELSPDGRIGLADSWDAGILVFDLAQGRLLYRDTTVGPGATFTPSGDTIAALARHADSLVLLDAATGARLAAVEVASEYGSWVFAYISRLTWDPFRPWLIGFRGDYECGAHYLVIDRRTWSVVRPPVGGDCGAWDGAITVSRADPVGWILVPWSWPTSPFMIGTFYIPGP